MLNGDAHHSEVEGELRIRPVALFQRLDRAHDSKRRAPLITPSSPLPPKLGRSVPSKPAVILYVEQNRMLLQTVQDVLEFAGWYVKPCSEEGYAVAYVESTQHHFDLLLIDHDSRELSGLKLTERARRQPHRKKTPIVLISLEDIAEDARRAGADAFLRKPNNLIELVDTIKRLLDAGDAGAP
jgi:CheY-like chemotaxis protein